MAVALLDFVPSLKREVQPPGTELFAGVTDAQWVGYLSDAFWEARLDGFLEGYATDGDDDEVEIIPVNSGSNDMDRSGVALVVLYAGVKVLRNRVLNMGVGFRAKAGPVEFEQQNSARMLVEMLQQLKATKDRILASLQAQHSNVMLLDAYSSRVWSNLSYFGGPELAGSIDGYAGSVTTGNAGNAPESLTGGI